MLILFNVLLHHNTPLTVNCLILNRYLLPVTGIVISLCYIIVGVLIKCKFVQIIDVLVLITIVMLKFNYVIRDIIIDNYNVYKLQYIYIF
jgi:hypothetical protein